MLFRGRIEPFFAALPTRTERCGRLRAPLGLEYTNLSWRTELDGVERRVTSKVAFRTDTSTGGPFVSCGRLTQ